MQTKLQALAAALWQTANTTGKAGKQLDSELAIACYVKEHTRELRLGRQHRFPSPQETRICRAVFGVPDTAASRSYVGTNTWHIWEFTWEQSS
jgi:hypothetical protein